MTLLLTRAALIARAPARSLGRLAARLLAFGFKVRARAHLFEDTRVIHALLETAQHLLEALRSPFLARATIGAFRFHTDLWLRLRVSHAGLLLLHSTPFHRPVHRPALPSDQLSAISHRIHHSSLRHNPPACYRQRSTVDADR